MNYPVMLNLKGKSCLIVGGGKVATRKVSHLLDAEAVLTVISPEISTSVQKWHREGRIQWIEQAYHFELLSKYAPVLVFAATDSAILNQQLKSDARQIGAWCNTVDDPEDSDFHNMALVESPPITLAISTNGASPALLKLIKAALEQFLGAEYSILAQWLKNLRDSIELESLNERQSLYESIVQSDILDLLKDGQEAPAREHFEALVERVRV
jgi:siroheme synthase-like protein